MATPDRGKSLAVSGVERSPKNFRWSQPYEDVLIELLVREKRKGNRPDCSFTPTAFRNVVTDFNTINGTAIMKKHVINRIKTMKSHFVMFHGAFKGLSGFSWNPQTKMFDAETYLWDQRIKENPMLQKFRDKACHNYDKLYELYGDTRATGDGAAGLAEEGKAMKRGLDFDNISLGETEEFQMGNLGVNDSSSFAEHAFSMDEGQHPNTPEDGSSFKSGGTSRSKQKRKDTLVSVMEAGYNKMADSIHELSMVLKETGAELRAGAKFDVSQNTSILGALDELILDEDYKMRCYLFLSVRPTQAALVVAATKERRAKLLGEIMGQSAS